MALYRCTAPQLAAIASISFLPGAVLSVPFGRWIDRVGSKKVLCVGFAAASVCLLLRIWVKTYWPLLSLTLIAGIFSCTDGRRSGKAAGRMVLIKGNAGRFRTVRIFGGAGSGHRLCDGKSVPERKSGVSGHCRFTAAAVGGVALERRTGGTWRGERQRPCRSGNALRSAKPKSLESCRLCFYRFRRFAGAQYLSDARAHLQKARCPRRQRPSARS